MINDEADDFIKELFNTIKNKYQNNLGKLMKDSEFVFDLLYYKYHKINLNRRGSNIDSPDWIKTKKQQQVLSIKKKINTFNVL